MDREIIREKATEHANETWDIKQKPNEWDNCFDDFQRGAMWVLKQMQEEV